MTVGVGAFMAARASMDIDVHLSETARALAGLRQIHIEG